VLARVEGSVGGLVAGTGVGWADSAGAGLAGGLRVLGGSAFTGALASRTSTARAARASNGVLCGSLAAGAVEGGLFAAGALGLLGADALGALAAAGGSLVGSHCGGLFGKTRLFG